MGDGNLWQTLFKGASIKYVRAEGGGGCQRNNQFLRTIVLIGCVKSVQEGGGCPKSRKLCVHTCPLTMFAFRARMSSPAPSMTSSRKTSAPAPMVGFTNAELSKVRDIINARLHGQITLNPLFFCRVIWSEAEAARC